MDWTLPSTAELAQRLRAFGLLSTPTTEEPPLRAEDFGDPRDFIAALVERRCLTSFQAERILAGKSRRLLVGPYVLLERIGHGGMGRVYKARHRWMKRIVALKLVGRCRRGRRHGAPRRRFRREVEAAGQVRHPDIVAAYDAGEGNGFFYLAMEFLEGVDLQRLVNDTGPLSASLAVELMRQTAEALHHTHQCGLLHRDIKPANLMLVPPGARVKLLDFGLACLRDTSLSVPSRRAQCVERSGTPDYMAPEWWDDPNAVDGRADLYSLGCTFYYLLSGRVPFPGDSWPEKVLRHNFDTPTPLRELRPEVPAEIAAIVERLMARERANRYPTAADVAADLAALGDRLVPSDPREVGPSPDKPRRSRPKVVRFSLAATVAVLLGVLAAGGARWMVKPPSKTIAWRAGAAVIPTPALSPPFAIAGRADTFTSLERAITAARDGDVVTLRGTGPFVTVPVRWHSKALTLRAEGTARPRLRIKANEDPWRALLHSDRALTLEGLDLEQTSATGAPLIRVEDAPVRLRDCRLTCAAGGTAIAARNPEEVHLERCRIEAGVVGVSVEVGRGSTCRLRAIDSRIIVADSSGAAWSLWAPEIARPTPIEMELQGNTIQAGRTLALRALPSTLTIAARNNRFTFRSALLSYTGLIEPDAWRRNTSWQGGDNTYDGPASWLTVEGRPVPFDAQVSPH